MWLTEPTCLSSRRVRQPGASPSLSVHSTAVSFGVGSAPGKARQTGQVCVFASVAKVFSQRQNIFVRVFSWTWISRPTTGSHSAIEELFRLQQRHLDVSAHLEHGEVFLERHVDAEAADLTLA